MTEQVVIPQGVVDKGETVPQQAYICPHCGARAVGEICEYCGSTTGIETAAATLIYPEFKVVDYTYVNGAPMLFFAALWETITLTVNVGFLAFPLVLEETDKPAFMNLFGLLFFGMFHFLGIMVGVMGLRSNIKRKAILRKGRVMEATCYGFTSTAIKWLVEINGNPMFIFTPRSVQHREYQIGWKVDFKVLDNFVCMVENSLRVK